MNQEFIEQVKEFRIRCDQLIQNASLLKTSAETTLAFRSLQMAKCWMGKLLSELGEKSPYQEPESASEIAKPADAYSGDLAFFDPFDRVQSITSMRKEIQNLIDAVKPYLFLHSGNVVQSNVISNLIEARFWYGLEFQNLAPDTARK